MELRRRARNASVVFCGQKKGALVGRGELRPNLNVTDDRRVYLLHGI